MLSFRSCPIQELFDDHDFDRACGSGDSVAFISVMWGVGIYNRLVTLKNRYLNAFSQIEVQLKRRYDLIPNLVETVKGYMAHERGTLEAVIAARNQAVGGLGKASANPGDPAAMQALSSTQSKGYPERSAGCSLSRKPTQT